MAIPKKVAAASKSAAKVSSAAAVAKISGTKTPANTKAGFKKVEPLKKVAKPAAISSRQVLKVVAKQAVEAKKNLQDTTSVKKQANLPKFRRKYTLYIFLKKNAVKNFLIF